MGIRDEIKAGPHRSRKTVNVCLRVDLVSQWEELNGQLETEQAQKSGERKLSDKQSPLVAQMDELVEQITASTYPVTVEALDRQRWNEVTADHPPREGHREDVALGVNGMTFFEAVIPESIVDPELDDEEKRALLAMLHHSQFRELSGAVLALNRSSVDIPLPSSAWQVPESSDGTSRPLSGSASRSSASTAGNRGK